MKIPWRAIERVRRQLALEDLARERDARNPSPESAGAVNDDTINPKENSNG